MGLKNLFEDASKPSKTTDKHGGSDTEMPDAGPLSNSDASIVVHPNNNNNNGNTSEAANFDTDRVDPLDEILGLGRDSPIEFSDSEASTLRSAHRKRRRRAAETEATEVKPTINISNGAESGKVKVKCTVVVVVPSGSNSRLEQLSDEDATDGDSVTNSSASGDSVSQDGGDS